MHARYIELLTRSGDYYRFLSEMLKSLEDLKVIYLLCFLGGSEKKMEWNLIIIASLEPGFGHTHWYTFTGI